jgi:uncharacterized protein YdhG (YjbR/CyaY superfamily)
MNTAQASPSNIDEYIAGFPRDVQRILEQIRTTIRRAAPDAEETIKYRIPTFVLGGNLVHFAAFKHHVGFYPTPSGIKTFKDELALYQSAKGSVQFPIDKPIPLTLIGKIVRCRVQEVRAKSAAKRGAPKHE